MSFWSFVKDVLPTVLKTGATIYGAKQSSDATALAGQQATQASQEATAAYLEGLRQSQLQFEQQQKAASPGLRALQGQVARGARLTPDQERAVEDSRRESINALKGSSLRGSARATSAIVSDTDTRVRGGFRERNIRQSDDAAKALSGQYFGAGSNLANTYANQGNIASQGLLNTGNIQSSSTLGQGAIKGQAIGDIGAIIADQIKNSELEKYNQNYEEAV